MTGRFSPRPGLYYCVHCLSSGLELSSAAELFEHLSGSHGLERAAEGRDWVSGGQALALLAAQPASSERRASSFALRLAACVGVDDLLRPLP